MNPAFEIGQILNTESFGVVEVTAIYQGVAGSGEKFAYAVKDNDSGDIFLAYAQQLEQ
jgi:hypothetical protein